MNRSIRSTRLRSLVHRSIAHDHQTELSCQAPRSMSARRRSQSLSQADRRILPDFILDRWINRVHRRLELRTQGRLRRLEDYQCGPHPSHYRRPCPVSSETELGKTRFFAQALRASYFVHRRLLRDHSSGDLYLGMASKRGSPGIVPRLRLHLQQGCRRVARSSSRRCRPHPHQLPLNGSGRHMGKSQRWLTARKPLIIVDLPLVSEVWPRQKDSSFGGPSRAFVLRNSWSHITRVVQLWQ